MEHTATGNSENVAEDAESITNKEKLVKVNHKVMEHTATGNSENMAEDAESITNKEKDVSPDINFVAIKEEPYNEEEDYIDENTNDEEFQFNSSGTEHEGPTKGGENSIEDQEKLYSAEIVKKEDPHLPGETIQKHLPGYDPLYLCEVTFGSGNTKSKHCGQAEVSEQSSQTSATADVIIKEELCVEDGEGKHPTTEEEYYTRVQTMQENRASKSGFNFRHNRNLIIPDLLTSCIQCGSAECHCFHVKRKRRSRKTVKMKFECDVCHKVLASRKTLKQHHLTHSGIRNYACPICQKAFIQLRQLSEHRLIHTGIKKYQCETCNKAFTQRRTLAQHRLIHSDIKRYVCDVCSKAFLQRSSLAQHKFVHSDIRKHKCDVCDKAFSQHRKLSEHKLIHSGIKKYQCDICLKSFTQQRTLSQHRLIHSDEKNHKCDVCGKAFTRRDTLLRHRLIHSNVKKKSEKVKEILKENQLTLSDLNDSENRFVSDNFVNNTNVSN